MSDLAQHLRRTTEQMACSARVKRSLWNEHVIACLNSAKAIDRLEAERDALRAQLDEAREALVFYANKKVYEPDSVGRFSDLTFRARFVLKMIKGGGDEG